MWLLVSAALAAFGQSKDASPDYLRDVKPIFAQKCYACHGALQQKAREILGTPATAADDAVLLGKFKDMMQARAAGPQAGIQGQAIPELAMTDAELTGILEDMDFDFCEGAGGGPLSS